MGRGKGREDRGRIKVEQDREREVRQRAGKSVVRIHKKAQRQSKPSLIVASLPRGQQVLHSRHLFSSLSLSLTLSLSFDLLNFPLANAVPVIYGPTSLSLPLTCSSSLSHYLAVNRCVTYIYESLPLETISSGEHASPSLPLRQLIMTITLLNCSVVPRFY